MATFWDPIDELIEATKRFAEAERALAKARSAVYEAHMEEMRRVARGEIELRDPQTGKRLSPPVE